VERVSGGMPSFLQRFGSSRKADDRDSLPGPWAHLKAYRGPHHEKFQEQSLEEFLTLYPAQCAPLSAREHEDIRRGCILLNDAIAGRASHGLFSLLDEAPWKRCVSATPHSLPPSVIH
jgi:hypothetical protein